VAEAVEDLGARKKLEATKDMEVAHEDLGEATTVCSLELEGDQILAPPPLSTLPDFSQEPPPFFHLEQLTLIFELKSYMADQIHRDTLMHQGIHMLYEEYSNSTTSLRTTPSTVTRATRPQVKMGTLLALAITSILNLAPCTAKE
jgi:hypothetical protein